MRKVLLSRRSVIGHLLVTAVVVAFILLGRWQWDESQSPGGDLQNLAYAVQWWLFCVIGVFGWARMLREEVRVRAGLEAPPAPAPPVVSDWAAATAADIEAHSPLAGREVVARSADADPDEELRAWNDLLAHFDAHPRR